MPIRATRGARWSTTSLLKIRLRRTGAKKQPSYRVVVAESTAPRDGTFLEILGHYNPLTEPTTLVIKEDRVKDWLEPDLKGLVEYVARALVDKPTAVKVDEVQDGNTTVYELEVDEEDIGKVIGRQGRVVRGLRALVKAAATRKGIRVDLDVV